MPNKSTAALHALKRYNDAIAAYEEGIAKFPNDDALKKGLEQVKLEKDGPPFRSGMGGGGGGMPGGMANPFGNQLLQRIMLNPKTRPYLNDKEFMAKLQKLQRDPNSLTEMISDPKIMEVLGLAFGAAEGEDMDNDDAPAPPKPAEKPPAKKEETKEPVKKEVVVEEEEEDLSQLSPAERKKKEDQLAATKCKERGNELYKAKKFDEAVAAYDEAIALDPTNMTFLCNKAAVYLTSKKYDDCIEACTAAVEVGNANRAPFEERAKAYTRCAKAYQMKGELGNAIEMCRKAQLECYDKATERYMKNMELEKKKADATAYHDDEKADEAKQRGNEHFRNKNW